MIVDVSVWPSVVVGLGSGVAGAFVAGAYQLKFERRTRRHEAAAQFLTAADQFRRTVRTQQKPTIEESIRSIVDAWDELAATLSVVRLLFGWETRTANAAVAAAGAFDEVKRQYVEHGAPVDWPDEVQKQVDIAMTVADEYLRWFAERAGGGPLRRCRISWRVSGARFRNWRGRDNR